MQRDAPLDAVDSRVVFRTYAAVVGPVGLFVAMWGSIWVGGPLNGQPWGVNSVTRMFGIAIVGAAIWAWAVGSLPSPRERRRMLGWFVLAHMIVWLMATIQVSAVWSEALPSQARWLYYGLATVTMGLAAGLIRSRGDLPSVAATLGLFTRKEPTLRSQYEESIRQAAAQEERSRLARDLHDSIKQQVFAMQTSAAAAETRFTTDPNGARMALSQVRDSARDAMAEMDAMLDQMRIAPIENAGLVEALKKQCEALELRTGARVTFTVGPLPPSELLPAGAHQALLRIAQEALSNIARHARATEAAVTLERRVDALTLTITDNGSGMPAGATRAGMGLRNIHERASDVGGDASISSPTGEGTAVFVSIPLPLGDVRSYGTQALWGVTATAFLVFVLLATRSNGQENTVFYFLLVPMLIDTSRYVVAWRRARRIRMSAG